MAAPPRPKVPATLRIDFTELVSYLRTRALIPRKWSADDEDHLRLAHRACFAFATWDEVLPAKRNPARRFLREVRADSINCVPLAIGGNAKTAALLERSTIEGCLKYVYFFNHPVELGWMSQEPKFVVPIDSLCEYASKLPRLPRIGRTPDLIPALRDLYWKCSQEVHGRPAHGSKSARVLSDIVFDADQWRLSSGRLRHIGILCNTLLFAFHRREFGFFRLDDRRSIQCGIDPRHWKACLDS